MRRLLVLAALSFPLLTACGEDTASTGTLAPASVAPTPTPAAAVLLQNTRVTTLGTRAETAQPYGTLAANRNANLDWRAFEYDRPADFPGQVTLPIQLIRMDDGVRLAAKVTLPATANGQAAPGPFPVILIQTSYNTSAGGFVPAIGGPDPYLVQRGYATVVVDVRGTGNSAGQWEAFGAREQKDYGQVVDWVVAQPWANGSVGLYGVSYLGITAMLTAAQQHPAVKAAFPIVPIGDGYRDIVFTGGQANATFIPLWLVLVTGLSLPTLETLTVDPTQSLTALLDHVLGFATNFQLPTLLKAVLGDNETAFDNDFWTVRSPIEQAAQINVPTFVVGGTSDLFQRSEPMWFERLKDRVSTKLFIGPWTHIQAAGVPSDGLPDEASGIPRMNQLVLRWFDQHVQGRVEARADEMPNVTQFVLGHGYATATDWPHPEARAAQLFLRAGGRLAEDAPVQAEAPSIAPQLPIFGLCSRSTVQWTAGALGFLPLPCFENDNLNQTTAAVFRTAPLDEDLYLNGPIQANLWITTTALEAGVSVRVAAFNPGTGKARALTNGLLTASLRAVDPRRSRFLDGVMIQPWHTFARGDRLPVTPGTPTEMNVEIFATSARLKAGEQLQIAVASSNLPQGLAPLPALLPSAAGVLTVLNTPEHPSNVVLPVVPTKVLDE